MSLQLGLPWEEKKPVDASKSEHAKLAHEHASHVVGHHGAGDSAKGEMTKEQ